MINPISCFGFGEGACRAGGAEYLSTDGGVGNWLYRLLTKAFFFPGTLNLKSLLAAYTGFSYLTCMRALYSTGIPSRRFFNDGSSFAWI
jgi:hypothetical protein